MEVIHHLRSCCTHCFQNGPTRWKSLIEIYWNIPKSMTWCKGRSSQFYSQRPAISNSWGFGCAIACPGRRLSWSMAAAGAHFISKKRESFTHHAGSTLAGLHDDFNIWYMIYIYIMYIHIIYIPMMCIYNIQYYIYMYIIIKYPTSRSLVLGTRMDNNKWNGQSFAVTDSVCCELANLSLSSFWNQPLANIALVKSGYPAKVTATISGNVLSPK